MKSFGSFKKSALTLNKQTVSNLDTWAMGRVLGAGGAETDSGAETDGGRTIVLHETTSDPIVTRANSCLPCNILRATGKEC